MALVGRLARLAAAPHQQQLIGRIDDAVNAFGEHRRRTGNSSGNEFGNRDPEVRQQCDDQRSIACRR